MPERKSWRYLVSDAVGAAEGLAFDEALMLHYGRGRSPRSEAALRLYTYRGDCALVGRYQHLEQEVDLAACAARGVEVGRRPTGGGAIIMGPGQLGVAITARYAAEESPRETLRRYAEGVIAGLGALGVEAAFRSKNDLEVGGRKIAGLGVYRDAHGGVLFHSSVLVDLDVAAMLQVLRIPGAKFSDKAVRSVGERVTTVSGELGRSLTAADVRERFAGGLAEAFGVELLASKLDADESLRHRELTERYASSEWLHQRSPRDDGGGMAVLKTPEGLLRIHAGIHGGVIKSVLLSGDFNVLPAGVKSLESALRWCRAEPEAITEVAREALDEADLGVAPERVAEAIWKAVSSGDRPARASHPRREAGSCYFPEEPGAAQGEPKPAAEERSVHEPS